MYETYCEIWARFLNVCYFSFNQSNTLKNFNYNLNINFKKEINYSLKQANQIFSIIYLNDYKEETNIFCYYILTSVLMFYYKDFFIWCKNNNYNYINFNKDKNNILNFGWAVVSSRDHFDTTSDLASVPEPVPFARIDIDVFIHNSELRATILTSIASLSTR